MRRNLRRIVLAMVLSGLLVPCGCGGGSVMAPPIRLLFVAGAAPAPMTVTSDSGVGSSDSVAVVDISATSVLDVLAASFTLGFDTSAVRFLGFDVASSHLGSDGTTVQPVVQQTQPGVLTVGVTRLSATGIDFSGTRLLIRVRFARVAGSGTSNLTFTSTDLLDDSAPPQPIPGVQWFGGSFRIN